MPAIRKSPFFRVIVLEDRQRALPGLAQDGGVQHDEVVGVVDLVRHSGDQDPEGRHLAGLHQLLLMHLGLLLRPLAFGDVAHHAPEPDGGAFRVAHQRQRGLHDFSGSVLGDDLPVKRLGGLPGVVHAQEHFIGPLGGLRRHVLPVVHSDQLVPGISNDPAQGIVAKHQVAAQVDLVVAFLDAVQDGPVFLLAFAQGLLDADPVDHLLLQGFERLAQFDAPGFNEGERLDQPKGQEECLGENEGQQAEGGEECGVDDALDVQHVVEHREAEDQHAHDQQEGFELLPGRVREQQAERVHAEHQGENFVVRQGVGEDGGRCHEHPGGKRQADGENRPQQPPVQPGEEGAQEQAEGRNRQVERQVLQLDQQTPVEVRHQLHEIALVGREQPRGHQEAADAEIERRPELSADDEKAQVIDGHDGDAAEDEEVKLAFQRMLSADLRFRSQADAVPQPAPAVMEIGHLQQNVDTIGLRPKRHHHRELAGDRSVLRCAGRADRHYRRLIEEAHIGGGYFPDFQRQRFLGAGQQHGQAIGGEPLPGQFQAIQPEVIPEFRYGDVPGLGRGGCV